MPVEFQFADFAISRSQQRSQQITFQPRHQHLAFRIAEAGIVLHQLGAGLGDHQPQIQHTHIWAALGGEGRDGGADEFIQRHLFQRRRQHRRRRIGAHAAGVRPDVAVTHTLMILCAGE